VAANLTWFGDKADQHDALVRDTERILDRWVERSNFSQTSMLGASTIIAFMRFGQSFTDLMRLGNGIASGGVKGALHDGLRLVSIAGIGGAAVSRLSRVAVLKQAAGTQTCTWVTTANALRRTGQRFFASLEDLAKAAGVSLPKITAQGSTVAEIRALIDALRKMSVAVKEVTPANSTLQEVVNIARANKNGVFAFSIKYGEQGSSYAHRLYATFSNSAGLTIVDTTQQVYRDVAALAKAYPGAALSSMPQFIIENASLIVAAETAHTAGGLASVVLELVGISAPPKPPSK
jgi:hypothetical protein